jgi:hypothetical protein
MPPEMFTAVTNLIFIKFLKRNLVGLLTAHFLTKKYVFGLCRSSNIYDKYNVSETGRVYVIR